MSKIDFVPVHELSDSEFSEFVKQYLFFNNDMDLKDYGKKMSGEKEEGLKKWLLGQRKIPGTGKWRLIIARVDGKLAGFTNINLVSQDKSVRLYEIYVDPKYRGSKLRLGDRFILESLKLGKKLGFERFWVGNASTIPSNGGIKKLIERIIKQPLGKFPEDYPRSMKRKNPFSRIFLTKEGTMGFTGDPNWARARAIRYKDTKKGFVKFPSFTLPITQKTIAAARGRVRK
ncbi:MAG: GNAT family N-acetyltransferase [archaeon]|jgi:hypothetical protein